MSVAIIRDKSKRQRPIIRCGGGLVQAPVHEPLDPWDMQRGESSVAYEYFKLFMDMGPERTIAAAAEALGKYPDYIYRQAGKHNWWVRARAWDAHVAAIARQKIEDAHVDMHIRQAELGMEMQQVALTKIRQVKANPALLDEVTVPDAARLAAEGVKIERLARGESTEQNAGAIFVLPGQLPSWAPTNTPVKQIEAGGDKAEDAGA